MLIKISKTTYFPHSNHPLLVIGQSNQNLKNLKKNLKSRLSRNTRLPTSSTVNCLSIKKIFSLDDRGTAFSITEVPRRKRCHTVKYVFSCKYSNQQHCAVTEQSLWTVVLVRLLCVTVVMCYCVRGCVYWF